MKIYQTFNKKTDCWVKYKVVKGKGSKILNVKQREPTKPFKKVKIK